MAVSNYKDLYKAKDVDIRVKNLASYFQKENKGFNASKGKNTLQAQIAYLKAKEKKLFIKLGLTDYENPLEELNRRLLEYKKTVLNLSGRGLEKNIISLLSENTLTQSTQFEEAVREIIFSEIFPQSQQIIADSASQALLKNLRTGTKGDKGGLRAFHATHGMPLGEGSLSTEDFIGQLEINLFTKEQKAEWEKRIVARAEQDSKKHKKGLTKCQIYTEAKNSKIETYFTITENLTPKGAKAQESENPSKISLVNINIRNYILSMCPEANQPALKWAINEIFARDKYAFFVGKSIPEVTGILGEVQSLYYLYLLLGGKTTSLRWKGGTHTGKNNAKPHQDILFHDIGIQVKNSTKEIDGMSEMLISFRSMKIDSFLKEAGITNQRTVSAFENYFGTYQFNVPYQHINKKYQRTEKAEDTAAGSLFNEARTNLENLHYDVDRLFSIAAEALMYLDAGQLGNADSNTLFILGGTAAVTASSILQDILKELESKSRQKSLVMVNSYQKEHGQNIVGVLNEGLIKGKNKTVSQNILSSVTLEAKYNFNIHNLLAY